MWKFRACLSALVIPLATALSCEQCLCNEWKINAQTVGESENIGETVASTLDHLRYTFPNENFILDYSDGSGLVGTVKSHGCDFFITDAITFAKLAKETGAWALAAMKSPHARTASRTTGSAFIVRSDREDLANIKDLEGTKAGIVDTEISPSFLIALNEINRIFGDKAFFKEVVKSPSSMEKLVHDVVSGKIDVAIVDACLLERMEQRGNIEKGLVKVIGDKKDPDFSCAHSTDLFPGWVFAVATPQKNLTTDQMQTISEVTEALRKVPQLESIMLWTDPTDPKEVLALQNTLEQTNAPKKHLKEVFLNYSKPIAIFLLIVLAVFFHWIYVSWLVRRRTRELSGAMVKMDNLYKEIAKERELVTSLEKNSIVSQMSAMIAHELQQPLAAIVNYARGLRITTENRSISPGRQREILQEIADQGMLAADIVNKVRGYVRKEKTTKEIIDISAFLKAVVEKFKRIKRVAFPVKLNLCNSIEVKADRLELELLFFNLMKNAMEATQSTPDPEIIITMHKTDPGHVAIDISDNGPIVENVDPESFFQPGNTSKSEGLGLGLSICRSIAEKHDGSLCILKDNKGVLIFRTTLPIVAKDENHEGK